MKKIVLFYAKFGGGHLSAANSLKQYLEANYSNEYEVEIIDFFAYINKALNKISTDFYTYVTKHSPWLWARMYKNSNSGLLSKVSKRSFQVLSNRMLKLLKEKEPDIVISCHPFSSQMCSYLKKKQKYNFSLATVMTDFEAHDQWVVGHEYTDFIFVANNNMKKVLTRKGIDPDKIYVTGIPLSNRFLEHFDREEIKKSFDLDTNINKKTILFFAGGEFGLAKNNILDILKALIDYREDIQIVVIAGKNEKLKEKFERLVDETASSHFIKVMGFTDKVPELMAISDLVITKPGGLTTTESLASGLPIVVINPIPGQEEGNAKFLKESECAIRINKNDDVERKIKKLLSDPDKLRDMKIKTKLIAKKNSTEEICKTILNNYQLIKISGKNNEEDYHFKIYDEENEE